MVWRHQKRLIRILEKFSDFMQMFKGFFMNRQNWHLSFILNLFRRSFLPWFQKFICQLMKMRNSLDNIKNWCFSKNYLSNDPFPVENNTFLFQIWILRVKIRREKIIRKKLKNTLDVVFWLLEEVFYHKCRKTWDLHLAANEKVHI